VRVSHKQKLVFKAVVEVCCRGVEVVVEVFEAAVEVSRPLSKCRGCCRGVRGRRRSIEAAVQVFKAAVEVEAAV
jgi:hypothetical protein